MRYTLAVIAALCAIGCGSDGGGSPTAPTPPRIADVAGNWTIRYTGTAVNGGDCIAAIFQPLVGSTFAGRMSVTQASASVLAKTVLDSDGSTCDYSGTADANSIVITGSRFNCSMNTVRSIPCTGASGTRDMELQSVAMSLSVATGTMTGTATETWNIYAPGRLQTSTLVATYRIAANR